MLFYFHGLASVGDSPRTDILKKKLNMKVLSPTLPVDPDKVIDIVTNMMHKYHQTGEKMIMVGTSLGGFWANYFAVKTASPVVLINPVIKPTITMQRKVGRYIKLFAKQTNSEDILNHSLEKFKILEDELNTHNKTEVYLFLAKDDTILDYQETLTDIKYDKLFLEDIGGHRFEHHYEKIADVINEISAK